MTTKLNNYVRTFRLRHGLSQRQLAWLLGLRGHASVSRIESGVQIPTLEEAIALEIVLETPVRTLFRGLTAKVERDLARRRGLTDDEDPANEGRA